MPANLTPLVPDGQVSRTGNLTNQSGGTTNLHQVLVDNNYGSTGTYVYGSTTEVGSLILTLSNTTSAFGSMATAKSVVRVGNHGSTHSDDTVGIYAQIFADAAATTALTNEVQIAYGSDSVFGVAREVNHTIVGTPTKAQWDGAHLRLRWTFSASMGNDGVRLGVDEYQLGGTFEPAFAYSGPITMSSAGTLGLAIRSAQTAANGSEGIDSPTSPAYWQTDFGTLAIFQEEDYTPTETTDYMIHQSESRFYVGNDWKAPLASGAFTTHTGFSVQATSISMTGLPNRAYLHGSARGNSAYSNERLYKCVMLWNSGNTSYQLHTLYTTDGTTWVKPSTPISSTRSLNPHRTIEYVTPFGQYVFATDGGEIYSSSDGLNWTPRVQDASTLDMSNSTAGWNGAFAASLGRFAFVGVHFVSSSWRTVVYYTDDAAIWTKIDLPVGVKMDNIHWSAAKGRFYGVDVNSATGTIYTSTDAITWTTLGSPGVGAHSVEWVPAWSLFVCCTFSDVRTSPDGVTWTLRMTDSPTWQRLAAAWCTQESGGHLLTASRGRLRRLGRRVSTTDRWSQRQATSLSPEVQAVTPAPCREASGIKSRRSIRQLRASPVAHAFRSVITRASVAR
jgi:hypothetical protein